MSNDRGVEVAKKAESQEKEQWDEVTRRDETGTAEGFGDDPDAAAEEQAQEREGDVAEERAYGERLGGGTRDIEPPAPSIGGNRPGGKEEARGQHA